MSKEMVIEELDKKVFKGLTFKTNKKIKVAAEGGGEADAYVPDEVPLSHEHILTAKDLGTHIQLVTADGRKHRVVKPPDPPAPPKAKEEGKGKEEGKANKGGK